MQNIHINDASEGVSLDSELNSFLGHDIANGHIVTMGGAKWPQVGFN